MDKNYKKHPMTTTKKTTETREKRSRFWEKRKWAAKLDDSKLNELRRKEQLQQQENSKVSIFP